MFRIRIEGRLECLVTSREDRLDGRSVVGRVGSVQLAERNADGSGNSFPFLGKHG